MRKRLHWEIGAEHGQSVSKDLSQGLKCSGTIGTVSDERARPKEHRTERGRSCERRRPASPKRPLPPSFLFTPVAPSHPIRGSVSVLSVDPNRGSSLSGKGVDTEVPIPTEVLLSRIARGVAQTSGQLMNVQVGPVLMTSRLTAAQAEEIFLLSHEIQTLHGSWPWSSSNCPIQRQISAWGPRPPAMNILFRSVLSQAGAARPHSARVKKPGCTSILYSFITLLITNNSWYG